MRLPKIEQLLERLGQVYGRESFSISASWQEDDSIGIASPSEEWHLAYVCWYPSGYFVSLETPTPAGDRRPYASLGEYSDLTLHAAVELIANHLDLPAA